MAVEAIDLNAPSPHFNWKRVAHLLLLSRAMDDIEEQELVPAKLVFNQFSARGHDLAQILIGSMLDHKHDAATGYYRSRPFVLSLGLDIVDAGLANGKIRRLQRRP